MYAHYMQNSESDCGIAAVRTILEQLKYRVKESELYKNYHINQTQGLSLTRLKEILEDYGIHSNAYGVSDFSELKKVTHFPVVLVVENDGLAHYILVHEIKGNEFVVSDPAQPEIEIYDESYIQSIFIGYALCLEEQVGSILNQKEMVEDKSVGEIIYKEIMSSITRKEKLKMVALMLLKYVLPMGITMIMQNSMESSSTGSVLGIILPVGLSFLMVSLFFLINRWESRKKVGIENKIQEKVLMKYYHTKMSDIYSGQNIENISGYFWNLFYSVSGLLEKFYLNLNLTYLVGLLFFLGVVNPGLVAVVIFWGVLFTGYLAKKVIEIRNTEKDIIGKSSGFFQTVEDNIRNSFDVNMSAKKSIAGQFVKNKMSDYFTSKYQSVDHSAQVTSVYELFKVMILISAFVFLTLSTQGVTLLNASNNILIISMVLNSVSPVVQTWLNYETSKVSIDHIQSSNDYQEEVVENMKERLDVQEINQLSLQDISFSYGEKEVIKNLNLSFESGKIYGISGKNGVGKSTLVKLISGVLAPDSGNVTINQTLHRTGTVNTTINEFISIYSSECGIYRNSLARNIHFKVFNEQMTAEEKTTYDDFFQLGLLGSYQIQNGGSNLSQGQKQKVLLMRTLLQDKDIYIFDEPSGNLDYQSKQVLKAKIRKLAEKNKIVLLISHEEDVMEIADQVITLERGSEK